METARKTRIHYVPLANRLYEFIFTDKGGRKRDNAPVRLLPLSLSLFFRLCPSLTVSSTSFTETDSSLSYLARNYARSPPLCPFNGIKVR